MHLLLIYDISDDRIRARVASACQDYGLDRIQYSAFEGRLTRTHQEELMLKIRRLLGQQPGSICLLPISLKEWEKRLEIANRNPQLRPIDDGANANDQDEENRENSNNDL